MNLNFSNLSGAATSLAGHVAQLTRATNSPKQGDIDRVTTAILDADNKAIQILLAPPPPLPTGQINFAGFDAAAAAFKRDGRLTQQAVDTITHEIEVNTP